MLHIVSRTHLRPLSAATALALALGMVAPAFAQGRVHLDGLQDAPLHDRFLVGYREDSPQRRSESVLQRSLLEAAASSGAGKSLRLVKLRRTATGAEVVKANRALDRAQAESLMRQIAADPEVEYVEVDQLLQPSLEPSDTRYAEQWAYFEPAGGIRANQAWDRSNGSGVVVAVLDTGITDHSDLRSNIVAGYDMISDLTKAGDGDGRDADPSDPGDTYGGRYSTWHGTHVTGTVAAVTNNALGVAGTAWGARVEPVRVLGRGGGFISDIADGIVWASGGSVSGVPANANPGEVINMSLGGSGSCASTFQIAIDAAVARGTTVVVAAGNNGLDVSGTQPANCKNVIAVGATDRNGARASFSNWGTGIDLSAPGVNILSTLNTGTTFPDSEGYGMMSGTSMSAPHVAGVVALMQAAAASPLTPASVESVLKTTARPLPVTCSYGCGAGIVDARAAVDAVIGSATTSTTTCTATGKKADRCK